MKEKIEEVKTFTDEDDKSANVSSNGKTICTNCGEEIPENKMVTHTVACYRNTTKCKVCGERLKKTMKAEHLATWRNADRIKTSIAKNNEEELTLILDHGIDLETTIEPGKQSK